MQRLTNRRVVLVCLAVLASFVFLYLSFSQRSLVTLLNGMLAGSMVAIAVTYHKLLWDGWVNPNDYGRVRQMTLTIAGQWLVIALACTSSIVSSTTDSPTTISIGISLSRWIAIWVAIFQVTAPDYGRGVFHGADRKFLGLGVLSGLAIAIIALFLQGD